MNVSGVFENIIAELLEEIRTQLGERCIRSADVLRISAYTVLSGARSGRVYGGHVASAPGEPPAARTGAYRESWYSSAQTGGDIFLSRVESSSSLAPMLECGTARMAPRPHQERIKEKALPEIMKIYAEPYA